VGDQSEFPSFAIDCVVPVEDTVTAEQYEAFCQLGPPATYALVFSLMLAFGVDELATLLNYAIGAPQSFPRRGRVSPAWLCRAPHPRQQGSRLQGPG
jgi:hypothetical protein